MAEDAPALAALSHASVLGPSVLGRQPGAPALRLGRDPDAPSVTTTGPRHARLGGFDLHANRTVHAHDRVGLEELRRYLLRPPLGQGRLEILPRRAGLLPARASVERRHAPPDLYSARIPGKTCMPHPAPARQLAPLPWFMLSSA
jgi:hypothetical protein